MRIFKMTIVTVALMAVVAFADSGIDLSGQWRLNKDLSDDTRGILREQMEKAREQRGDSGGGRGGGKGGGGGRGGGGRGGGGRGGGGQPQMSQEEMQEHGDRLEKARESIHIVNGATGVSMIYATGDTVTVVPDGVERKRTTMMGEHRVTAYWDELDLVVVVEPSDRPQQRRRYRINDDGQLEIVTVLNLPMLEAPVEVVAVYDEVK
jgi:hypothetical protein